MEPDRHYRRASAMVEDELEVPDDMRHHVFRRVGYDAGQQFIADVLVVARAMLMALGDRFITAETFGHICQSASLVATDNYWARVRGLGE